MPGSSCPGIAPRRRWRSCSDHVPAVPDRLRRAHGRPPAPSASQQRLSRPGGSRQGRQGGHRRILAGQPANREGLTRAGNVTTCGDSHGTDELGTGTGQSGRLRVDALPARPDRDRAAATDTDIEVEPVPGRFAVRYHLERYPRSPPAGIDDAVRASAQPSVSPGAGNMPSPVCGEPLTPARPPYQRSCQRVPLLGGESTECGPRRTLAE